MYGSVGRAPLKPIYVRQHSRVHVNKLTPVLRCALGWLGEAVASGRPRPVRLHGDNVRRAVAFVDASGEGWLGAMLITPENKRFFVRSFLNNTYKEILRPRGNYIQFLEMAAAFLLLVTFPEELTNTELDLYCDNTAQEGALRRGFSRAWDLAVVAGTFWSKASELQIDMWIDRVPTRYNPSDYPTRFEEFDANGYVRAVHTLGFAEKQAGSLVPLFNAIEKLRGKESPD